MMMLPDKKNAASLIVAKIKPGKEMDEMKEVESNAPLSDFSAAKEDAAKKMMEALEKKDAKMFSSHLQDFMDMCEEGESSEYESEME